MLTLSTNSRVVNFSSLCRDAGRKFHKCRSLSSFPWITSICQSRSLVLRDRQFGKTIYYFYVTRILNKQRPATVWARQYCKLIQVTRHIGTYSTNFWYWFTSDIGRTSTSERYSLTISGCKSRSSPDRWNSEDLDYLQQIENRGLDPGG